MCGNVEIRLVMQWYFCKICVLTTLPSVSKANREDILTLSDKKWFENNLEKHETQNRKIMDLINLKKKGQLAIYINVSEKNQLQCYS